MSPFPRLLFYEEMTNGSLHIGQMIRAVLKSKKATVTDLAAKINTTRTNMHKILRKDNIDIKLLFRISNALEHDFFEDISETLTHKQK